MAPGIGPTDALRNDPSSPVQSPPPRRQSVLGPRLDLAAALFLTLTVVALHGIRVARAGALWRDEAGAVQLAMLPSFADAARNFTHEAFPLLFPAAVRAFGHISGGGDFGWRIFGLLVGVGLVAALWWNMRQICRGVPLLSVALLGFNAAFLQWGDEMRGYGLGTLLMLVTVGLFWRFLEKSSPPRIAAAAFGALASVQCLFQNAPLLFALCLAGATLAFMRRNHRQGALALGIGFVAALSLLPYLPALRAARDWDVVIRTDTGLDQIGGQLAEALSSTAGWHIAVWAVLFLAAIGVSIHSQSREDTSEFGRPQRAVLLFSGVALALAVIASAVFFLVLGYPGAMWYFLALMGFVALFLDVAFDTLRPCPWAQIGRLALVLVIAAASLSALIPHARLRNTNIDLVAEKIAGDADKDDLIIVSPWYLCVSFNRYYHGRAPWVTIPLLNFYTYHRYDLIKAQMLLPDQNDVVRPILDKIQTTLKGGHRVWMVGVNRLLPPGFVAAAPTPAPDPNLGWINGAYALRWTTMTMSYLQACAKHADTIPVTLGDPVSHVEHLPLVIVFDGWSGP